jgi:LysR family hydrogen peroxide-inducible transcriptional activator
MTFQQLQYVVALEESGNFTAAAQTCHVTQPTLSAQIKKLENEWGTPLFDRSEHPIRPTAAGERVVAEARAALARLNLVAETMRLDRDEIGGTLEVGVIPTLAPYLLPRVLAAVRERLPRARLNIREALTADVAEQVRRGRWDLGLVSTPTRLGGLVERPLYREAFLAYLPPGHELLGRAAVPVAGLEKAGLLLLKEGHCFRDQVLALCSRERETPVAFESGSLDTLMRLVDAGHGATLVPEGMVLDLEEERRASVRPIEGPEPARVIGTVTAPQTPKAALTAAFKQAVRDALPSRWKALA